MELMGAIHEQVRDQFALLNPQPGTSLAEAIDRAVALVHDHEQANEIAWNSWLDDQRELEDAKNEIRRLHEQLVGTPIPEEETNAA